MNAAKAPSHGAEGDQCGSPKKARRGWKGTEGLTRELLQLGGANELTRSIKTILYHAAFPVDVRHNSKIFREKLADWAAKKLRP